MTKEVFIVAAENATNQNYRDFSKSLQEAAILEIWDLEKVEDNADDLEGDDYSEKLEGRLDNASALVFVSSKQLVEFLDKDTIMESHRGYITRNMTKSTNKALKKLYKSGDVKVIAVSFDEDIHLGKTFKKFAATFPNVKPNDRSSMNPIIQELS